MNVVPPCDLLPCSPIRFDDGIDTPSRKDEATVGTARDTPQFAISVVLQRPNHVKMRRRISHRRRVVIVLLVNEEGNEIDVEGNVLYASDTVFCCLLLIWSVEMRLRERIVG